MSPAEFEPAIPASVRPPTYALDRAATGIGDNIIFRAIKGVTKSSRVVKGRGVGILVGTQRAPNVKDQGPWIKYI
jgi:hypothetical protein